MGKTIIDTNECTLLGIGYPKKLRNENTITGSQQTMSVATIRDILKSIVCSFLGLFFESLSDLVDFMLININTYPIVIKTTRNKLKLIKIKLNFEIKEEREKKLGMHTAEELYYPKKFFMCIPVFGY